MKLKTQLQQFCSCLVSVMGVKVQNIINGSIVLANNILNFLNSLY